MASSSSNITPSPLPPHHALHQPSMGCASSTRLGRQPLKHSRSAPLPRSISMPVFHPPDKEGDSYHFVSLTSSSYGALTLPNDSNGSFLRFCRGKEGDGYGMWEEDAIESISTRELMEGLQAGLSPLPALFPATMEPEELVSFPMVEESNAQSAKPGSPPASKSIKPQMPNGPPSTMQNFLAASCKLSPVNKSFMANLSFGGDAEHSFASSMQKSSSGRPLSAHSVTGASRNDSDCLAADDWHTVESASSSSDNSCDADIPQLQSTASVWNTRENSLFDAGSEGKGEKSNGKKQSFAKILPMDYVNKCRTHGYLESFEVKCPPKGEGKVVLYFTSMRGIRKTYEDCFELKLILEGTGVYVDERDVWMHSKFKQELTDLFGKAICLPRLFINGRYVGGMEQVKKLHDGGILTKLLEGLPVNVSREICDGCGDVRFVPCLTCSGSCKVISADNLVLRCADCNENGLIMCPLCS